MTQTTTNTTGAIEKMLGRLGIEGGASHSSTSSHTALPNHASPYNALSEAVELAMTKAIESIDLNTPTLEGESKRFYRVGKMAFVELKPTMYSFTYNRYGTVEGTDDIRQRFWRLFATHLNSYVCDALITGKKQDVELDHMLAELVEKGYIDAEFPLIANYLGGITHQGKQYAIVSFAESLPPLEVVWKQYLVGTMKHTLKKVDAYNTLGALGGKPQQYEGAMPADIIRFDWRNPLPDKDECIPDEFAAFYIDAEAARAVARFASKLLNRFLHEHGYELVDLCYFMNNEGNRIHSEITPDGMRIRKHAMGTDSSGGASYDKDLWRMGKDRDTIVSTWSELYRDLAGGST